MDGLTSTESRKGALQAQHWITGLNILTICLLSLSRWPSLYSMPQRTTITRKYLHPFGGSDSKESACNVGDLASIPGLGRSPGEGNSYPLHYSCLENSMDLVDTTKQLSLSPSCLLGSLRVPINDRRRLTLSCIMITFFKFHRKKKSDRCYQYENTRKNSR